MNMTCRNRRKGSDGDSTFASERCGGEAEGYATTRMADIIPPGGNSYRVFRAARELDRKRDQDGESNLRPRRARSYGKQSTSCYICEGSSTVSPPTLEIFTNAARIPLEFLCHENDSRLDIHSRRSLASRSVARTRRRFPPR